MAEEKKPPSWTWEGDELVLAGGGRYKLRRGAVDAQQWAVDLLATVEALDMLDDRKYLVGGFDDAHAVAAGIRKGRKHIADLACQMDSPFEPSGIAKVMTPEELGAVARQAAERLV